MSVSVPTKATSPTPTGANGDATGGNGSPSIRRRRATAESMAAGQRDISVSEFFAKNRHLLGFDNPRKALLTTVKEAVDNALDACEEAGILPEIWVHIQRVGPDRYKVGVQDNGPGILRKQIPLIFGKLLYGSKFHRLRMSRGQQGIGISAAGMHGAADHRQAGQDHVEGLAPQARPLLRNPDRHQAEPARDPQRTRRRRRNPAQPPRTAGHRKARASSGTSRTTARGSRSSSKPDTSAAGAASTSISNRPPSPIRTWPSITPIPTATARNTPASPTNCRRSRRRSSRTPTASNWAGWWPCSSRPKAPTVAQFLSHSFSRVSPGVARRICAAAKIGTRSNPRKIGRHEADLLYQAIQAHEDSRPGLPTASRRSARSRS